MNLRNSQDGSSSCQCTTTLYGEKRKPRSMCCEFHDCGRICKKVSARSLVVSRAWIRKEVVRNTYVQTEWRVGWCRYTAELVLRTIIFRHSAQYLRSSGGHVRRTGLLNLWLTCWSEQVRAHGDANMLHDCEQKFAILPDHLQLIILCSNVGMTRTVTKGQFFTTLDDAELDKLGGSS